MRPQEWWGLEGLWFLKWHSEWQLKSSRWRGAERRRPLGVSSRLPVLGLEAGLPVKKLPFML